MTNRTFLITGASGFIGSWVCKILSKEFPESRVIGVGQKPIFTRKTSENNFEYISCNLLIPEDIKRLLPGKVNAIIHLAGDARTFLRLQEATNQFIHSALLAAHVANYAVAAKAELLIQASSVYLYSGHSKLPFSEEPLALPSENLGASKIAAEALFKARAVAGDFRALALRIFTVYGPQSRETQFIPQAIKKLLSKEITAYFGIREIKRDFIYVEDVATAFLAALNSPSQKEPFLALNVGSGIQTSIQEIVSLLADLLGVKKEIKFAEKISTDLANGDHQADLLRIRSVLNWKPLVSLKTGLSRTIQSLTFSQR